MLFPRIIIIPVILEHVEITPGHERMGMSPDKIVSQHPGITDSDVYAASAYYHDHLE